MAELLLELFCEEIPARMQARACEDLQRLLREVLATASLTPETLESYATPRRLALVATGMPLAQPDTREERRGPRVDAPEKAIDGFLKSTGLTRDQLEERSDGKATFLYATLERSGRPAADVLAELIPPILRTFPWPKSMRWGERSRDPACLRWVRPLQSIICLLDGAVVPLELEGIKADSITRGHRFHGNSSFRVDDFEGYRTKLRLNGVILDPAERMRVIQTGAEKLAQTAGLTLIEDGGLLAENAGLTEWPVPLLGTFDRAFLEVPREVIQLTMRVNQKYFALNNTETGALSNHFVCVANIDAADKGKAIVAGNEKVLAARLSDARFFWEQDRRQPLAAYLPRLAQIKFHEKLGSMQEKAERVAKLAEHLAAQIPGCDPALARRAGLLAKADLVTGMVGEFPELQGVMGGYYATSSGEDPQVAQAIAEHYAPAGPSDRCPTAPVSIAVALADKIDTLTGFFAIDEKPTGSRDPYALRRAALGVIRLIVENGLRLNLSTLFGGDDSLLAFVLERLKVQQRESGVRHDHIDAARGQGGNDDLVRLLARVTALQDFLATDDGANLLAGYKRAANILAIEEKKDARLYCEAVDAAALTDPAEVALAQSLSRVGPSAERAVTSEDFTGAMAELAALRPAVDQFFAAVMVNAADPAVRANRLCLLNGIRTAIHAVADFSLIEG